MATECGGDQGRWWAFHDHFMTTRDFTRDGAVAHARELGLDDDRFAQCLDDEAHLETVYEHHRAATESGVRFTPTVRVNGEGAPVTEALVERVLELVETLQ